MALPPITEMRPREILAARDQTGILFIPVSPAFEWHAWHLPLGTDALIAEELSQAVAERVGGLYCPTLSFGLDEWRPAPWLAQRGLPTVEPIFGMNFPVLPLAGEYHAREEMVRPVATRLEVMRRNGFRYLFLINNHGGRGQANSLNALAREMDSPACRVCYVQVQSLPRENDLPCGGHANLDNETAMLMAFRPDLVDLAALPEGELRVAEVGILYPEPVIPPEHNPRHTSLLGAHQRRRMLIDRLTELVQAVVAGDPMTGNAGPDPY